MPIVIMVGRQVATVAARSPLSFGVVGTVDLAAGESAPTYGEFSRVRTVEEAQAVFGSGQDADGRDGSIVEFVKIVDQHRVPIIHAAAVDVSAGLELSATRNAINAVIDTIPTSVDFLFCPGLTCNFDSSGNPLTTVCSTVARLQSRAAAARGIAITDTAWGSVADAITYLGVAGNTASRVLPMAIRMEGATDDLYHPASAYQGGALLDWIDARGSQANWSGIPVNGVTGQEHEALRTPGDPNSDVQRIRNAGGTVIAWSGSEWKSYGGILGGAGNTEFERFASVRRVEDILISRLYTAFEPYEEENLTQDTIPALVAVGRREMRRARAEGLIGGFTLAPDDAYNTPANLAAANVGLSVSIEAFSPIGTIQITVNFNPFAPEGAAAA